MAHPAYLREKARQLREDRKLTIDELAERLALSRSTIYYWVRDLPLARQGRANAGQRRGNRVMRRNYRLRREAAYQEGLESFARLAAERTFRDFICLYLAEGSKRRPHAAEICNSDDAILRVALAWMRRLCNKSPCFSIQYHADQNLHELRAFWSKALDIPPEAIRFQRKSNSSQLSGRQWRSRHGVLSIRLNDTYFRTRLQAWIDCLRSEWARNPG
jgi:AcrR family transcriptional regulator